MGNGKRLICFLSGFGVGVDAPVGLGEGLIHQTAEFRPRHGPFMHLPSVSAWADRWADDECGRCADAVQFGFGTIGVHQSARGCFIGTAVELLLHLCIRVCDRCSSFAGQAALAIK